MMHGKRAIRNLFCSLVLAAVGHFCQAQTASVNVHVQIVRDARLIKNASNVVVWLTPLSNPHSGRPEAPAASHWRLVQSGKQFEPHLLVVPVGAAVEFPNQDPFFHNVFSLFEGKRFDLGLYEAGSTRTVRFDKPGISYIFCNIHPQMSAIVIALSTPYYAVSGHNGAINIAGVPDGRYRVNFWYEGAPADELQHLAREVTVSGPNYSLGLIRLKESRLVQLSHKNKYGQDYDDPTPATPGYAQ
jgi:plastocyanin